MIREAIGTPPAAHPWRVPSRARVLGGLGAVDADAWDRLVPPGGGGLRHAFLLAWEQCELPGLRARPLALSAPSGHGLIAAAPAYLFDLDLAAVRQLSSPRVVACVRRAWPRFMLARVLELGGPTAAVVPLLSDQTAGGRQAAEAILDAAIAEAHAAGAAFTLVQDTAPDGSPLAEALRARRFVRLPILPTAVLEHNCDSFDHYLGAVRSRYRNRARRAMRDSGHLWVERLDEFGDLAGQLAMLWRLVYDRATETKREILAEPFFSAVADVPETSVLLLRRPDGSIAAFGLLLRDAPWLHFLQCGFSVAAARNEAAYFRLLLEVVRAGIDGGFRLVHLGCTTLSPKLDLGARTVPLHAWIRHRNPLIHRACRVFARLSEREALVRSHDVFADRG